jgi:SAM-dependent methyltransferase
MAQHTTIYQQAIYYDMVFNRDVSRDVDFLQQAYRLHAGGELSAVLDVACGPGYHARACAQRGLHGAGLDLRPEMIAYARDQATSEGVEVEWVVGDMRDFQLSRPVDVAICPYDGIDALVENDDLVAHFRAVAANLTSRGLYVIENIHPRACSYYHYGRHTYRGERDGVKVEITLGANEPEFDPITGIAEVAVQMIVRNGKEIANISDTARERLYSPQEIRLLAEKSDALEIVAWYGEMDLEQPLDNSQGAQSMIAVLQKKA